MPDGEDATQRRRHTEKTPDGEDARRRRRQTEKTPDGEDARRRVGIEKVYVCR